MFGCWVAFGFVCVLLTLFAGFLIRFCFVCVVLNWIIFGFDLLGYR